MGFTSLAFLAFFPIVWLIYLALPGRARAAWLLAASYVFCLSFGIEYLLVLLGSTLVTWLGALGLEKRRNISEAQGRLLFGAVIVFHVAALSFSNTTVWGCCFLWEFPFTPFRPSVIWQTYGRAGRKQRKIC